ncbi:hypothetical protein [Streptomyces sp. NPDC007856]|uniref:hypothetical protein n=1 Tax=Streptomyces sp. NPDC007856 TaxID=3364781 RepID=UPI0036C8ED16
MRAQRVKRYVVMSTAGFLLAGGAAIGTAGTASAAPAQHNLNVHSRVVDCGCGGWHHRHHRHHGRGGWGGWGWGGGNRGGWGWGGGNWGWGNWGGGNWGGGNWGGGGWGWGGGGR